MAHRLKSARIQTVQGSYSNQIAELQEKVVSVKLQGESQEHRNCRKNREPKKGPCEQKSTPSLIRTDTQELSYFCNPCCPNPQKDNQAGLCHLCDQSQLPGKESLSCTVDGNRRWRISAHLQTIKLVQRSKPCWDGATEVVA